METSRSARSLIRGMKRTAIATTSPIRAVRTPTNCSGRQTRSMNATIAVTRVVAVTTAAASTSVSSRSTVTVPVAVTARYWLVEITRLPAYGGGFRGGVSELSFSP